MFEVIKNIAVSPYMYLFFDLLASFDHWLVIRDVTEIIFRLQVRCRVCFTMAVVLQSTTGNC